MAATAAPTTATQGRLRQPCRAAPCSRSKNRPKPPVVIAHECPSVVRAHVLEVPAGRDVLSCVAVFARRARRGALVLGAVGHVAGAVLRQEPAALVLRGTMEILGLAGCFFPSPSLSPAAAGVAVLLSGLRGSVLGGGVAAGGLVAAGPVVVVLATFVEAEFDRLPLVKGEDSVSANGCDEHVVAGRRRRGGPLPPQKQCGCVGHWAVVSNIG